MGKWRPRPIGVGECYGGQWKGRKPDARCLPFRAREPPPPLCAPKCRRGRGAARTRCQSRSSKAVLHLFPGCFARNTLRGGQDLVVRKWQGRDLNPSLPAFTIGFSTEIGRWGSLAQTPCGERTANGVRAEAATRRARGQPPAVQPLPPVVMGARRRRRR